MFARLIAACCAAVFLAGGALAQKAADLGGGPDPLKTFTEADLRGVRASMELAQKYRTTCDDIKNSRAGSTVPAQSVLADFQQDRSVLAAIGSFCAFGTFELDESDATGKCDKPRRLEQKHIDFIRNLPMIAVEADQRRISLKCVAIPQFLLIRGLKAGSIEFVDVEIDRVLVAASSLPGGLVVTRSRFPHGLFVYGSDIPSQLQINSSTFGTYAPYEMALGTGTTTVSDFTVSSSTIEGTINISGMVADKSVRIADSKIGQNLYVANVRAEGSLRIQSTDVAGELSMTNSRVNGQLQLTSVTVAKQITFDYMTVLRAELSKSTFTGTVFFDHTKVDRHLQILDTTLSEGILARLLRADDVEITKTKTGSELFFKSLMASSLRISDLKALSADCKACTLNISNAHVGNVAILDFKGNEITAGNGRFNTFDLSKGVISNFDCSDCAIEQYIAIKGKILRFADLRGLKVNGALLLSEEGRRSCWGKGAFINMAQFKADTLGIDAEDIVAEERENSTDSCERTAKGPFVSVRMTGATYRAITGGRNAYDGPPSTDAGKPGVGTSATISAKSHPITDLAAPQLIQFIRGYKAENAQDYDPQPYEEMANALTRAGVTDKATALKIARIDDRVASPETGVLERLWYRIYRLASRYGFENERVAVVFLLLLFAGTAIHHAQVDCLPGVQIVEGKKTSLLGRILYSFWFSLDRAIPPLHLEMHSEADAGLPWLVLHYFYMHRVLGTFLLSVFAAGAAGVGH